MNSYIISAIGSDRPGIVSEVSGVITRHGGNVEESRMTSLGSDFAIIMLLSVSLDWEESLQVALKSINDVTIIVQKTTIQKSKQLLKYQMDLSGADNEGIVMVLTKYLADNSINIVEMNTNISLAPVTGTPLFNLNAIIECSENIMIKDIYSGLNNLSIKLGVEIELNRYKSI